MKVDIRHVEKSQGLIFRKTLYGVTVAVSFNEEEKQIIRQRGIEREIVLDRDAPADVDAKKHAERGLVRKIATAAVKGIDANHFALTFGKLMNGPDTYFHRTLVDAKMYEEDLREALVVAKAYITESAGIEQKSDSFEL